MKYNEKRQNRPSNTNNKTKARNIEMIRQKRIPFVYFCHWSWIFFHKTWCSLNGSESDRLPDNNECVHNAYSVKNFFSIFSLSKKETPKMTDYNVNIVWLRKISKAKHRIDNESWKLKASGYGKVEWNCHIDCLNCMLNTWMVEYSPLQALGSSLLSEQSGIPLQYLDNGMHVPFGHFHSDTLPTNSQKQKRERERK